MDEEIIKERLTDFEEFLKSTIMLMVLGTSSIGVSPTMTSNIESILTLAIKTFFDDDDIKMRYKKAIEAGVGTPEWEDTPTLNDFYIYCSPGFIKLDSIASNSTEVLEALDQIKLRLKFWLNSRVGQSISQPSTFRNDARLVVFALRNLSSESDAAILALSAYSAALRKALSSPKSIFFLDEAPILFQFESIAQLIGRLCANGAKAGIRVILSAQELDSIFQSKAASKISTLISLRSRLRLTLILGLGPLVRMKNPSPVTRKLSILVAAFEVLAAIVLGKGAGAALLDFGLTTLKKFLVGLLGETALVSVFGGGSCTVHLLGVIPINLT